MSDPANLADVLLAHVSPTVSRHLDPPAALERWLADALERCRAAWPDLRQPAAEFLPYVAERLTAETPDVLRGLHFVDLYLAFACARADSKAVAAFEARYLPVIGRALGRLGATPEHKREVEQAMRVQLFVGTDNAGPAIATYSGRGPLSGWVRIAAVRAGCRLMQRARRDGGGHEELLEAVPSPEASQELEYLKRKYRREFQRAFAAAVESVGARERVLLRLHYVDGVSIDDVAKLYRVHRATAARWIAAARDGVLSGTRRALMEALQIPRDEYDSIIRLIRSELQVSLTRCLPEIDDLELAEGD